MHSESRFPFRIALASFGGILIAMALAPWSGASAYSLKTLYSFCADSNCTDGSGPSELTTDISGNLYGATYHGGANGDGSIFQLVPNQKKTKWKHILLYSFCSETGCSDGSSPNGNLILDAAGNLYGTTSAGGANNSGTAFELLPNAKRTKWKLKVLYGFCSQGGASCTDGDFPEAGLTYAGAASGTPYDGVSALYGITFGGLSGEFPGQSAFELKPGKGKWAEKVLHSFGSPSDGSQPDSLVVDSIGNLFGTTLDGTCPYCNGAVFELSPNAHKTKWQETLLYVFCPADGCLDGADPGSGLSMDASGNVFGTTSFGGSNCLDIGGCGVVFKVVPNGVSSQEIVLHNFCALADCADGMGPGSAPTIDTSGKLFGTTIFGGGHDIDKRGMGGGTVYQLSGTTLEVLYSFCAQTDCTDGAYPHSVVMDSSGDLFGTTSYGGKFGNNSSGGTVFELVP